MKAKGSEPLAWARISPMAAPWLKTASRGRQGWVGGDAFDGPAQAAAEHRAGLGAGDHVPALLAQHLLEHRVAVDRLLA